MSDEALSFNVGNYFTIESYLAHSKILPNKPSPQIAGLMASEWGFTDEPTTFENQQQQQASKTTVIPPQQKTNAPPVANNNQRNEDAAEKQQQQSPVATAGAPSSKPKKKVTIVLTPEEEKRVTESMTKLSLSSSPTSILKSAKPIKEGEWPMIDSEESTNILRAQAGTPLGQCHSTIPAALHEAYAPVYQLYLRQPHYFDSDFEATPQHKVAFDSFLAALSLEQSAYLNRVSDLVLRCQGCAAAASAASAASDDNNNENNHHLCENQNFISNEAKELYQKDESKKFAVSKITHQLAQNNEKHKNSLIFKKLGSAPCRIPHLIEKAKIPTDSSIVYSSFDEQLKEGSSRINRVVKHNASKIFTPALPLVNAASSSSSSLSSSSSAVEYERVKHALLEKLPSSIISSDSSPNVCFSISSLESLASTCFGGASPQSCISGDVVSGENSSPIVYLDSSTDSETISRREVMRKYFESLVLNSEHIFENNNNNNSPHQHHRQEFIISKVDVVDAVHELDIELTALSMNSKSKNNKKKPTKKELDYLKGLASSKMTSFFLQVPVVAKKKEDGSPIILLVKPEYSSQKSSSNNNNSTDENASSASSSIYRLERFSSAEVLFMFLCLRCVPRSNILVVRVSALNSSILATEMINLQHFNLILDQMSRWNEFHRVFALISGIVSKLRSIKKEDLSLTKDLSSSIAMLSLVRKIDSADFLFVRHPSLVLEDETFIQSIAEQMTTAKLRKAILPVDSWNLRSNRLMLTFPPKNESNNNNNNGSIKKIDEGERFEEDFSSATPEEVFRCIHSTIQVDSSDLINNTGAPESTTTMMMMGNTNNNQDEEDNKNEDAAEDDDNDKNSKKALPASKRKPKRMGTGSRAKGLHF